MIDAIYYGGVAITIIVLNVLSFISLAFVIGIYLLKWKQIASFPMRLSLYLCISCLIQNLYVLIYPPVLVYSNQMEGSQYQDYCVFEAMVKTSFDLSSIIWTSIIIFSSYASVVNGSLLERLELFYLCIGYLLPVLVSLIPIFLNYYGYNVYYCWLNADSKQIQFWLKMGYFFFPLWILFFLDSYWAIRTYRKLIELGLEGRELSIFKKLLLFPLILLGTGIFPTIDIIYIYVTGEFMEWLDVVSYFTLSCYGICTSLAYGFNPLIRDHIVILFGGTSVLVDRNSFDTSNSTSRTEKLAELITM